MSDHFVNLFAKGRWVEEDVPSVKFSPRRNIFPEGMLLTRRQLSKEKIKAKEFPRKVGFFRNRKYFCGYGLEIAKEFVLAGRYDYYVEKGVFELSGDEAIPHTFADAHKYIGGVIEDVFDKKVDRENKQEILRNFLQYLTGYLNVSKKDILEFRRGCRRFLAPSIPWETKEAIKWRILNGIAYSREISSYNVSQQAFKSSYVISFANAIDLLFAQLNDVEGNDKRPTKKKKSDNYSDAYGVVAKEFPESIWVNMKVFKAQMDKSLASMEIRDFLMSDVGVVPRRMDRLVTDGKIFNRSIPEYGASVLIDASGSMSISSKTISKIVEVAPAAVVAMYFGGEGEIPYSDEYWEGGFVVILAENGQACSDPSKYRLGLGNYCDGLALRWLGLQPGPRFWVSDGDVTGHGDGGGNNHRRDAAWCLDKFDIEWVNTCDAAEIVDIVSESLDKNSEVFSAA